MGQRKTYREKTARLQAMWNRIRFGWGATISAAPAFARFGFNTHALRGYVQWRIRRAVRAMCSGAYARTLSYEFFNATHNHRIYQKFTEFRERAPRAVKIHPDHQHCKYASAISRAPSQKQAEERSDDSPNYPAI